MMIRIDQDRHINPAFVVFMEWDRRHYFNGPGDSILIITMHDGVKHRVRHEDHLYGGADAYAVEKQILAALEAGGGA